MPPPVVTTDIRGSLILLGTGTSVGVPVIGCGCAVCQSGQAKNVRTRSSAIAGLPGGNLLIDTPPDLRQQLLRERIGTVHAVLYTHDHADHVFGLDDLRLFPFQLGGPVPLYCEPNVEQRIRKSFDYAFSDLPETHRGSRPSLVFESIGHQPFDVLGRRVIPIPLEHGPHFRVLGFRIGDVAYCTDASRIPPESLQRLQGLDTLVLDALRYTPHPTHLSVDDAVAVAQTLRPRRTVLTHMAHDLDYPTLQAKLPAGIEPGYDGMRINLVG